MTDRAVLIREIDALSPDARDEVLGFVESLKHRAGSGASPRGDTPPHSGLTPEEEAAVEAALAAGEPCPICERYRDPVTGELRFKDEVLAAFEDADAVLRGDIPVKWFGSAGKMWAAIRAELAAMDD